jgi:hypothetical protein
MLPNRISTIYKAFANLYGAILSDDVYSILKKHYPDLLKKELIENLKEKSQADTKGYIILKTNNNKYVIALTFIPIYEMDEVLSQRNIKSFYIYNDISDFLKYADSSYCEETPEYRRLYRFYKYTLRLSDDKIKKCFKTILHINRSGQTDMESIIKTINGKINTEDQVYDFLNIYQKFINNLRIPYNLGHTPVEVI